MPPTEILLYVNLGISGSVAGALILLLVRLGRILERFDEAGRTLNDHEDRLRSIEGVPVQARK